jgi:hypothetical protein
LYDQVEGRAGPVGILRLPKTHSPIKTETVNYFDEEAERQLRALYDQRRAEILRAIQDNQNAKAKAIAEIDRRIQELMNQKFDMN